MAAVQTYPWDHIQENKMKHVSVTSGMAGHFAVVVWWNPDGFWEPWDTGVGRYETRAEAVLEAVALADAEDLPFHI